MEFKIPFLINSSSDAGAQNISSTGDRFEINLEQPLVIPRHAKNCYIVVQQSQVWYNTPNIITGVNDKFKITYDGTTETITILQGLYDLSHLNAAIVRELTNLGFPEDLLELQADTSTQRTVFQFNYADTQIDFTAADSFEEILGFNQRLVPTSPTTGVQYEISDNVAAFSPLEYYLIHSDLVSRGLRVNSTYNQTIAQIPITTSPGSLNVYEPQNPPPIPCNELIGEKRKTIRFNITNDVNEGIDTQGEVWSCRFVLHYTLPN